MNLDNFRPRPLPVRYLAGYLNLLLGSMASRISVTGRNFIPQSGPYVVVINHFSVLDPFFVIYSMRRPISFLMASDQEVGADMGWAPWLYGFIPTNRSNLAPSTIKESLKALRNGEVLGIFPEATTFSTELRPAKDGAAYLSVTTGVPILPIGIHGTEDLWSNLFRGVRQKVNVNIGRPFGPFSFTAADRRNKRPVLQKFGDEIMCRIGALLPEENRGFVRGREEIELYQEENRSLSGQPPVFINR